MSFRLHRLSVRKFCAMWSQSAYAPVAMGGLHVIDSWIMCNPGRSGTA